jgi:hypothetical protein
MPEGRARRRPGELDRKCHLRFHCSPYRRTSAPRANQSAVRLRVGRRRFRRAHQRASAHRHRAACGSSLGGCARVVLHNPRRPRADFLLDRNSAGRQPRCRRPTTCPSTSPNYSIRHPCHRANPYRDRATAHRCSLRPRPGSWPVGDQSQARRQSHPPAHARLPTLRRTIPSPSTARQGRRVLVLWQGWAKPIAIATPKAPLLEGKVPSWLCLVVGGWDAILEPEIPPEA